MALPVALPALLEVLRAVLRVGGQSVPRSWVSRNLSVNFVKASGSLSEASHKSRNGVVI